MLFKHINRDSKQQICYSSFIKHFNRDTEHVGNKWAFWRFAVNKDGVFILYFWWGYAQNEDPGQIRWWPLIFLLLVSASVEIDIWAFFKRFPVNIDGVFVLYLWWGYVQNEDPGQIRW